MLTFLRLLEICHISEEFFTCVWVTYYDSLAQQWLWEINESDPYVRIFMRLVSVDSFCPSSGEAFLFHS